MFSNQHTDYKPVCGTVISDSPRAFSSVSDLIQECVGDLPPGGHAGLVVTELLGFDWLMVYDMAFACIGQPLQKVTLANTKISMVYQNFFRS